LNKHTHTESLSLSLSLSSEPHIKRSLPSQRKTAYRNISQPIKKPRKPLWLLLLLLFLVLLCLLLLLPLSLMFERPQTPSKKHQRGSTESQPATRNWFQSKGLEFRRRIPEAQNAELVLRSTASNPTTATSNKKKKQQRIRKHENTKNHKRQLMTKRVKTGPLFCQNVDSIPPSLLILPHIVPIPVHKHFHHSDPECPALDNHLKPPLYPGDVALNTDGPDVALWLPHRDNTHAPPTLRVTRHREPSLSLSRCVLSG